MAQRINRTWRYLPCTTRDLGCRCNILIGCACNPATGTGCAGHTSYVKAEHPDRPTREQFESYGEYARASVEFTPPCDERAICPIEAICPTTSPERATFVATTLIEQHTAVADRVEAIDTEKTCTSTVREHRAAASFYAESLAPLEPTPKAPLTVSALVGVDDPFSDPDGMHDKDENGAHRADCEQCIYDALPTSTIEHVADWVSGRTAIPLARDIATFGAANYGRSPEFTEIGPVSIKRNPHLTHECRPCNRVRYCASPEPGHCDTCLIEVAGNCGHDWHKVEAVAEFFYGEKAGSVVGISTCGLISVWMD